MRIGLVAVRGRPYAGSIPAARTMEITQRNNGYELTRTYVVGGEEYRSEMFFTHEEAEELLDQLRKQGDVNE